MGTTSAKELQGKKCKPCEGGVDPINPDQAEELLKGLDGWELEYDGSHIQKRWTTKNFTAGMTFLNQVAELAEDEGHHPDVHLTGYREVQIELTTHAIGGLSENDFILAAKINELPVDLKK